MLFLLRWLIPFAITVAWIWCVFDVIRSDVERVRYLHKLAWLAFVVLVPMLGALAWLLLGRPNPIGSRLIPAERPNAPPPDDSPEFLRRVDEEIKRRRRLEQMRRPEPEAHPDVDEEIERLEQEFGDDDEKS